MTERDQYILQFTRVGYDKITHHIETGVLEMGKCSD